MSNLREKNKWNVLNLDDDEKEHYKKINKEICNRLELTENGSIISLNGLVSLKKWPHTNEPEMVVNLLMIKSAKNVRYAIKGLKMGYYSGANAVLRSAFELLAYAVLINSKPARAIKWLNNELTNISFAKLMSYYRNETKKAKKEIYAKEKEPQIIKEAIEEYIKKANRCIHPSLVNLSEEFGIGLEFFTNEESVYNSKGDIPQNLNFNIKKRNDENSKPYENKAVDKYSESMIDIELLGKYNEDILTDLSLFSFYIAHRLLDYTNDFFKIENNEFYSDSKNWHKEIKKLK